jgi:hypothetical protein
MKIEFPETLEEIVVWAMEYSHGNTRSYFTQLYYSHRLMLMPIVKQQVNAWLKRIAPLGGAVTIDCMPNRSINPWHVYYRVSVAGIFVCVLDQTEHNEILGDCE